MTYTELAQYVSRYKDYFERLTPKSLEELDKYFDLDARFEGPLNDVRALDAIRRAFQDMHEQCADARYQVIHPARAGRTGYLHWNVDFRLRRWRRGKPQRVEGLARVIFNGEGKATEHVDYWDAAEQI